MGNGYDFTENEDEVLKEQRDDAKAALEWDGLDEKAIAGELNGLNSRISACIKQLSKMISDNSYLKTKDMLDALMLKDLSLEGWMSSFFNANKDAFLKAASSNKVPDWVSGLYPEEQKTYEMVLKYFIDIKMLLELSTSMYMILQMLPLTEGFKLMRIKDNFDAAGLDEGFYRKVDEDVRNISLLLNKDWNWLEKYTQKSQKFIEDNLQKLNKKELEKGYREERRKEYLELVRNYALGNTFLETSEGHFSVRADILANAEVIDNYTYRVSQTKDLKDALQKVIDECNITASVEITDAEKYCTTQSAQHLCAAFRTLAEEISKFAKLAKETYVSFKEAKDSAPYCFMKKLSSLDTAKPKYAFSPNTSDPWDRGTHYKHIYTQAASALGSQCRLFIYDHGTTIY